MRIHRSITSAAAAAMVISMSACAGGGLGTVGDILGGVLGPAAGGAGGGQQGQVTAEIQGVDERNQAIQFRTQDGRTGTAMFDRNTVVIYQQQQYPVTALERGDVVNMQLQQIDQNRLYTARIDVQQSVQERTGQTSSASGQLQQMYGTVGQIDRQNGFFQLQTQQGNYTVVIPSNAGAANVDRFNSLRTGQNVSIEGTVTGSTRIDLYRFI